MSTTQTQVIHTTPVLGLLGIAFIILKLTGYIAWSWWWVTAPFWAGTALLLGFAVGVALVGCLILAVTSVALFFTKKK